MKSPTCSSYLPFLALSTFSLIITTVFAHSKLGWLNHGGDLFNRRFADKETKISPKTVSGLSLKWKFYAGRDITATPALFKGTLYFPSWNGNLYAVNASNGSLIWKQNLEKLTGLKSTRVIPNVNVIASRATPTIADGLLLVGILGPCAIIGVQLSTGALVWSTQVDNHPSCIITMSGTYYKGHFYVGTASQEELVSPDKCCTFRGSFAKLDARTGAILWQTYMVPDNFGVRGEYSGAGIWGSSPSIDILRNHVYIATGNIYTVPKRITDCQERQNNQTQPTDPYACVEPDNHSQSILALDLGTGIIKWYHWLGEPEIRPYTCDSISSPVCPPTLNPDTDFGEAPMMLTININRTKKDIVVAVQKTGFAWALDRNNGKLVWYNEAGPGGLTGGGVWGAATDGKRVYTNIANSEANNFVLQPSKNITTGGGWVAMDAATGQILWSTADPSNATIDGPVSVANGVLFGGSTYKVGPVYAMDARTGKFLWSNNTGATVFGGMSVSDGCIYVGSGYKVSVGYETPAFSAGTSLFAFCISGRRNH